MPLEVLRPDWAVSSRVQALCTLRSGGVSAPPFESLNLSASSGDRRDAVLENRHRLSAELGAEPRWISQVHGSRVVRLGAVPDAPPPEADASITTEPGVACAVLVADCLPVLLARRDGLAVGAAHAGWRGLAGGVLEHTVAALCEASGADAADIAAWLGPCIGPRQFEVGADVLLAFGEQPGRESASFVRRDRADGSARWLADLPRLARQRLAAAGLRHISGGGWCTVEEASRFFSFRRDGPSGPTGRMAAAIAIGSG